MTVSTASSAESEVEDNLVLVEELFPVDVVVDDEVAEVVCEVVDVVDDSDSLVSGDGAVDNGAVSEDVVGNGVSSSALEPQPATRPVQLASTSAASARFMVPSVAGRALWLLVKRQGEAVL
ncbi:MAG: hypothetical protein SPK00_01740 [Corynebacterium glucuronolyticum]|nr:hypothetical protein [Mycobacteriaceae bacterium]MDY5833459.1 hypothetical protein [Corynebacterium glucuronolyticum]